MTVTEVLQWADSLVFANTNKHLDDLQETVIKGVWEKQTYEQIAEKSHRSESHIRDVGYKLLQVLSKELGEDINKSNFSATFKRLNLNSPQIIISNNKHNFNYNSPILFNSKEDNQENSNNSQLELIYHDLKLAPQIIKFYDRESELKQLENWVFNQNIKLISVLGLWGIGKSYLIRKFVDLNLEKFEVIIWQSLKFPKSLYLLLDDLLSICQQEIKENTDNKLRQLFDFLTQKKCLIIIDDVQNIFAMGELAGQYQAEYSNYQTFLKMMTEVNHQSNLILISQEKCQEMLCLDEELYPVKCLELEGLDNIKILENKGLKDEEYWLKLINLYEGNTIYLRAITIVIKEFFNGKVSTFLQEEELILTDSMKSSLRELFNRLNTIEKQIILELSKNKKVLSKEDLRKSLSLSSLDFINAFLSLKRRHLLRVTLRNNTDFNLSPIFREYVRNYCQN